MSKYCKNELNCLKKIIYIYIADNLIEYEKQNGHIVDNIPQYNNIIYKSLENGKFISWLYTKNIDCNIRDNEFLEYVINQIDKQYISLHYSVNILSYQNLEPCNIIDIFAHYEAEKTLILF